MRSPQKTHPRHESFPHGAPEVSHGVLRHVEIVYSLYSFTIAVLSNRQTIRLIWIDLESSLNMFEHGQSDGLHFFCERSQDDPETPVKGASMSDRITSCRSAKDQPAKTRDKVIPADLALLVLQPNQTHR